MTGSETRHALYVAAAEPTCKTAVIVHGYTDNSIRMLNIGYLYNRQLKYNILLPDLHGHGASEGAEIQMGWLDRLDVQWTATADELFGRNNETVTAGDSTRMRSSGTEMVVHGISMGAATTMMVSGEVEYGIHQQTVHQMFRRGPRAIPAYGMNSGRTESTIRFARFPAAACGKPALEQEHGWDFREASALEQVRKCTRPCSLYTAMRTLCAYMDGLPSLRSQAGTERAVDCSGFRTCHVQGLSAGIYEHVKKFVGNTYVDGFFLPFSPTNTISMKRFISIYSSCAFVS